jgi:hypothetical protein
MITYQDQSPATQSRVRLAAGADTNRRRYRVVVHGLRHFCEKLPGFLNNKQWEIRDRSRHTPGQLLALIRDLRECDLVFLWAGRIDMGRFLWGARSLGTQKIVIFWCGSDVLRAQQYFAKRKADPWITERIHWAASPSLAEEVRAMGLRCEFVQASFVEPIESPKPLPKEFSVLVYLPSAERSDLYGWDQIVEVARALPAMKFKLVGLRDGKPAQVPPNVSIQTWTENLKTEYEQTTVLWRPVRHDAGISFMVLEALAHGRHVLYTYPVSGALQTRTAEEARNQLQHLQAKHEEGALALNLDGMEIVARTYSQQVVRQELYKRWEAIILS